MTGIDRRRFLIAIAGAAGAGLAGGTGAWAAPTLSQGQVRAATYRALVRSLRAGPDVASVTSMRPPPTAATGGGTGVSPPPCVRTRMLCSTSWGRRGRPGYAELAGRPKGARGGGRSAIVAAALALACIGCEPSPAEDERPELPTLAPA